MTMRLFIKKLLSDCKRYKIILSIRSGSRSRQSEHAGLPSFTRTVTVIVIKWGWFVSNLLGERIIDFGGLSSTKLDLISPVSFLLLRVFGYVCYCRLSWPHRHVNVSYLTVSYRIMPNFTTCFNSQQCTLITRKKRANTYHTDFCVNSEED